ncbi:hypothetical protein LXL04_025966 [Taraxacum kok-saghyz]
MRPNEVFDWVDGSQLRPNQKSVVEVVVCAAMWIMWRYRNDVLHDSRKMRKGCILDCINEFAFLWFRYRQTKVWNWLSKWTGYFDKIPENFDNLTNSLGSIGNDKKYRSLIGNISYTMIWLLWKERNERHYGKRRWNPMQLADDIQLNAYNWVKNRGNMKHLKWVDWSMKPGVT